MVAGSTSGAVRIGRCGKLIFSVLQPALPSSYGDANWNSGGKVTDFEGGVSCRAKNHLTSASSEFTELVLPSGPSGQFHGRWLRPSALARKQVRGLDFRSGLV